METSLVRCPQDPRRYHFFGSKLSAHGESSLAAIVWLNDEGLLFHVCKPGQGRMWHMRCTWPTPHALLPLDSLVAPDLPILATP